MKTLLVRSKKLPKQKQKMHTKTMASILSGQLGMGPALEYG